MNPHEFSAKRGYDTCRQCGGLRITPDHGYDMAAEVSKAIMQTISDLASHWFGKLRIHPRYMPEVAALVCQNKLLLHRCDQEIIEVTWRVA